MKGIFYSGLFVFVKGCGLKGVFLEIFEKKIYFVMNYINSDFLIVELRLI